MILHKTDQDDTTLTLRRGTQGQTVQSVEATRHDGHVRLTTRRVGTKAVSVELDPAEVRALRDWLTPVPRSEEES